MDDGHRPFAIDIEFVGGVVDVPLPNPGRAAANLGKLQTLGTGKPFHVGRRGTDAQRLDNLASELFHLVVAGGVDAVGGYHLW